MKDEDLLPTTTASSTFSSASSSSTLCSVLCGRVRYKFWALAVILLLAFWSMLTGTVSLRWSGEFNGLTHDIDIPTHEDLDVLEMEEREKDVRRMWNVYTNSRRTKLPKFWEDAFKAAYGELTSDVPEVRNAAISEIAKMSVRNSIDLDPPLIKHTNASEISKSLELEVKQGSATTSEDGGQ